MTLTIKKEKKDNRKSVEKQEVKKLSKVGEWIKSGQSIGGTYDIRAILR